MTLDRRSFFKGIAALAATPLVSKIPIVGRVGAWATAKIVAGQVTEVQIINAGSGYSTPPTITFSGSNVYLEPPA